jgi:hypothetical protein
MGRGARYVERRFGEIEVRRDRKQSDLPAPGRALFLHLIAKQFEVIVADEEVLGASVCIKRRAAPFARTDDEDNDGWE